MKKPAKFPAKFIAFEGIDGCGKSTQCALLSDYLTQHNIAHITTREPGGSSLGEDVRNIFLSDDHQLDIKEEIFLLLAARHHHFTKKIAPALDNGQWVLCDRYHYSSYAYQAYMSHHDTNDIMRMIAQVSQLLFGDVNFMPTLNLIFDIPAAIAQQRYDARPDKPTRFEEKQWQWREDLRQAFLSLAQQNQHESIIVDASQDINKIHENVVDILVDLS